MSTYLCRSATNYTSHTACSTCSTHTHPIASPLHPCVAGVQMPKSTPPWHLSNISVIQYAATLSHRVFTAVVSTLTLMALPTSTYWQPPRCAIDTTGYVTWPHPARPHPTPPHRLSNTLMHNTLHRPVLLVSMFMPSARWRYHM